MKKNRIWLGLAFALGISIGTSFIPTKAHAVTSNVSGPSWGTNRLLYNSTSKAGFQGTNALGLADCTSGASVASALSYTSKQLCNVTSTAGLSPTGDTPYFGNFHITVVNTSSSTIVVWPSQLTYTVASTTPAGTVIAGGASANITVQSIDGLSIWGQSLTATSAVNVNVCVQ